ncbi:LysR family transcriptional regulator [Vagococcus sp.]|uniref:LysR family transcriptional regulator n=1 Tax=Vagococcus sp. TaxID=1933889 RepID=UPI003F9E045F
MFKWLKTFKVAYECKNFSVAAEHLYISQPAVSNQLKALEEELTCKLFVRSGKQEMKPTLEADLLYGRLLDLSDDWEETLQLLKGKKEEQKICRIGASHTFAIYYLPELLNQLLRFFPTIDFEIEMMNSEEVLEGIEKHHLHLGFIEKPLVTITSERLKLNQDELVLAGDLNSSFWLSREETSGVYHYMHQYLTEINLKPQMMLVKNNEMIIKLLEQGLGKSMVSKKALPEGMPYQSLNDCYQRHFYLLKGSHLVAKIYQNLVTKILEIQQD